MVYFPIKNSAKSSRMNIFQCFIGKFIKTKDSLKYLHIMKNKKMYRNAHATERRWKIQVILCKLFGICNRYW